MCYRINFRVLHVLQPRKGTGVFKSFLFGVIKMNEMTESRKLGVSSGSVPDPRFGVVKTYHSDILDIVFGENF